MSNDLTDAQFSAYIDRILECRKAEDEAKEDTKQAYADLKDAGGDKTEAGLLVRALRMDEKDAGKAKAREEMLEEARLRYRRGKASHVRAREATQSYAEAKGREKVTNGNLLATTPKANNPKASSAETGDLTTTPSELTDTQEQPETDPAGEYPAQVTRQPEGERSTVGEAVASPAPRVSPTPANAPRLAADDEAAQAQTSSAPSSLTRTPPVVDDGQPSPSANVPPAQNASSRSDVGQAGSIAGHSSGEFAQQSADLPWIGNEPEVGKAASVTLSQSEIPAFLRKTIADYRPNCLHPDMCAASGLRHCNACQKAMEAAERDVA